MSKITLQDLSHSYLQSQNKDEDWAIRNVNIDWHFLMLIKHCFHFMSMWYNLAFAHANAWCFSEAARRLLVFPKEYSEAVGQIIKI